MEQWTEVRRRVLAGEQSKRSVCLAFGIPWDALTKLLEHAEPPGYRRTQPRSKPKIGPFLGVIAEILTQDRQGQAQAPARAAGRAESLAQGLRGVQFVDGLRKDAA